MSESSAAAAVARPAHGDHVRHALEEVRPHLRRRALELVGFVLVVYVVLKLIPELEDALRAIEHASWEWVLALLALEVLSEVGFVFAWSRIVDPQNVLSRGGRGRRMDEHVA